MPFVDLHLDPFAELLLDDAGDDVADPLFRRLRQLELDLGQVEVDLWVVFVQELLDLLYSKYFVSKSRYSSEKLKWKNGTINIRHGANRFGYQK